MPPCRIDVSGFVRARRTHPRRLLTSAGGRLGAMETLDIGSDGGVRAEVLARGATVHRLLVPTATGPRNVVLGHPSTDDYGAEHACLDATVGRYANRIRGAAFELDGTRHTLGANQ